MALIMAVDRALRNADAAALGALWLDDGPFGRLCPGLKAADRADLETEQRRRREQGETQVAECLALTDWSQAQRLVLNYGSHTRRAEPVCSYQYLEHENAELFYVVGDTVYKVKLYDAVTFQGWHALGHRIRCSKKKPGSAAKAEQVARRLGTACPGLPWPALTQIRGSCPRL